MESFRVWAAVKDGAVHYPLYLSGDGLGGCHALYDVVVVGRWHDAGCLFHTLTESVFVASLGYEDTAGILGVVGDSIGRYDGEAGGERLKDDEWLDLGT